MGYNCLKATEPLRGGSLLFTTNFPEIPGTHLVDLGRMKGCVDLGATPFIGFFVLFHNHCYYLLSPYKTTTNDLMHITKLIYDK